MDGVIGPEVEWEEEDEVREASLREGGGWCWCLDAGDVFGRGWTTVLKKPILNLEKERVR